jgi:hypothetical protein
MHGLVLYSALARWRSDMLDKNNKYLNDALFLQAVYAGLVRFIAGSIHRRINLSKGRLNVMLCQLKT